MKRKKKKGKKRRKETTYYMYRQHTCIRIVHTNNSFTSLEKDFLRLRKIENSLIHGLEDIAISTSTA